MEKHIDWMAENFRDYGYDMICNDGWIEAAQTINENGYITKYNSEWQNGFEYWNKYIADKGMKVGVYYNPMWMTRAAYFANCPVEGTNGKTTMEWRSVVKSTAAGKMPFPSLPSDSP